jgi:hypothetical protein
MISLTLITRTLSGSSIGAVEVNREITTVVALLTIAETNTTNGEVATNVVAATKTTEAATPIIVGAEGIHREVAGTSSVVAPTNVVNQTTPIGNRLAVRATTKVPGPPLTFLTMKMPLMMTLTLKTARETPPIGNRRVPPRSPRLSAKRSN